MDTAFGLTAGAICIHAYWVAAAPAAAVTVVGERDARQLLLPRPQLTQQGGRPSGAYGAAAEALGCLIISFIRLWLRDRLPSAAGWAS